MSGIIAENELICVKLLGWKLLGRSRRGEKLWDDRSCLGHQWPTTPTFENWSDAGLILAALRGKVLVTLTQLRDGVPHRCSIIVEGDEIHRGYGASLPLALREATLAYLYARLSLTS